MSLEARIQQLETENADLRRALAQATEVIALLRRELAARMSTTPTVVQAEPEQPPADPKTPQPSPTTTGDPCPEPVKSSSAPSAHPPQPDSSSTPSEEEASQLRGQLATAQTRVAELERRVKQDSHNSHQPPASDGLRRRTRSLREKSGRPSGGQKGHSGQTLHWHSHPARITPHRPTQCQTCGTALDEIVGQVVERRQVYDLPEPRVEVEEHQVLQVCCPHCQTCTRGSFPSDVKAPVQYGPHVRALAVYWHQCHFVPMERTCQAMEEGFGCPISQGSLANWVQQASNGLGPTMERIRQGLLASPLLHGDETGIRITKKLHWLHSASTRWLTALHWHPSRGQEAIAGGGIWPLFGGRGMHDRFKGYDSYSCAHSVCGAHLLRDLTAVAELDGQLWAAQLKLVLIAMNKVASYWRAQGATHLPPQLHDRWVARYFQILGQGFAAQPPPPPRPPGKRGPPKQSLAKNLLDALLTRADQVLGFFADLSVPFTNNQAERDLRMAKVQQKVAGCFRSPEGATAFCRIRSYLSTMSKQGHAMLKALAAVFAGQPLPVAFSLG